MSDEPIPQVQVQATPSGNGRGYVVRQNPKQLAFIVAVLTIVTLIGNPLVQYVLGAYARGVRDKAIEARVDAAVLALHNHIVKYEPAVDDYQENRALWIKQFDNLREAIDELRQEIRENRTTTVREFRKRIPTKEEKDKR